MKLSNDYIYRMIVISLVLFLFGCNGGGDKVSGSGVGLSELVVDADTNEDLTEDIIHEEEHLTSIADISVKEGFDFSTTQQISLKVKTPVPGIIIRVLDKMPAGFNDAGEIDSDAGETELIKFITDNTGEYEIDGFSVPDYLDTIVLATHYIGLPDYIIVPIADGIVLVDYSDSVTFSNLRDKPGIKEYLSKISKWVKNVKLWDLILPASVCAQEPFNDYYYLGNSEGDWNNIGIPNYLEEDRDAISSELLTNINLSLPERISLPVHHPEYLYDAVGGDLQTSVHLTEEAEVFVTFVHEGAGYKNVLGYYYYGVNGIPEPSVVQDVENRTIIFPNVSYAGSGGGLISGDKVKLVGPNPDGTFPTGTIVGWFVLANGYKSYDQTVTKGNWTVYSDKILNEETPPDPDTDNIRQHVVFLYDSTAELFLLSFEDIKRDNSGCDQDFNDAIFYVTSNPVTAIDITDVAEIETTSAVDSDGDGISNDEDNYDNDAAKAFNNVSTGTLAFEDLWPRMGDYDFNDLVVEYSINRVTNAANYVVEIDANFTVRAIGAWYQNAFAFELPVDQADIRLVSGTFKSTTTDIFSYEANGLEAGQKGTASNPDALFTEDKSVVIVAENVTDLMKPGGNGYVNTKPEGTYITPQTISVVITIDPAKQVTLSAAGSPPWNPFIVVNVTNINENPTFTSYSTRAKEIHLSGMAPTNKADWLYHFGAGDDTTILPFHAGGPRYFKTVNNLPWALHIPERFEYPVERTDISNVHLKFINWAETGGTENNNWYQNLNGFRNAVHIYEKPSP